MKLINSHGLFTLSGPCSGWIHGEVCPIRPVKASHIAGEQAEKDIFKQDEETVGVQMDVRRYGCEFRETV